MATTAAPDDKATVDFVTFVEESVRGGFHFPAPVMIASYVDGAFELVTVPHLPADGDGAEIVAVLESAACHAEDIVAQNPDRTFVGVLTAVHTTCVAHGGSCTASLASLCGTDGRLFDKRTHDLRAAVPPTHPQVGDRVLDLVCGAGRLARALGRVLNPTRQEPEGLRFAWAEAAQEVLIAAACKEDERAFALFQRLHDDYGPHIIPDVLVTWARTTLQERGIDINPNPDRLRTMIFLDMDTGRVDEVDDVPPGVRWAGRLITAVSTMDTDQIEALVNSCTGPDEFSANCLAMLHVCALALRSGTLREV